MSHHHHAGCYFVKSLHKCFQKDCPNAALVVDSLTGRGYCAKHTPLLWMELAKVNLCRYYNGNLGHTEIQEADVR